MSIALARSTITTNQESAAGGRRAKRRHGSPRPAQFPKANPLPAKVMIIPVYEGWRTQTGLAPGLATFEDQAATLIYRR
jgi:hypothetical protein